MGPPPSDISICQAYLGKSPQFSRFLIMKAPLNHMHNKLKDFDAEKRMKKDKRKQKVRFSRHSLIMMQSDKLCAATYQNLCFSR